MKSTELLEKAIIKVGGISELARVLKWDKGTIAHIKKAGSTNKVPPYRAAMMAELLNMDTVAAYLTALGEQSKTPQEKAFWKEQLDERKKKLKYA